MRFRFALQSVLCLFVLLAVAVYAGRLLRLIGTAEIDFVGQSPSSLTVQTHRFIAGLEGRLALTFVVSPRERMPSHLKEVEGRVRALLDAFRDAAPELVDYRVIYPEVSGAPAVAYAARKKVSPISVRRIDRDEHSEEKVWSSLVLAHEGQPDLLIQGIRDTHLPYLEQWVLAHIGTQQTPPQASFAFSAPAGFEEFPRFLSQHGPVVQIDLDASPFIPPDTDILFWLAPQRVSALHVQQLKRYLASGRSVLLAGSSYDVEYAAHGDSVRAAALPGPAAWADLLRPFGLRPLPDWLMDRNSGALPVTLRDGSVREVDAPFHLRNLPAFRDFRRFRTPARGGLSFVAASPLQVDRRRAADAGFDAQIVATTTEHAWVRPLSPDLHELNQLSSKLTVPKQNLMVLLSPRDPWAGQLLVMASASAFRDRIIQRAGYGHSVVLTDLVRTFASPEELIRHAVDRGQPAELRPVGPGARLFWRLLTVFLVPLALAVVGLWRYLRFGGRFSLRGRLLMGVPLRLPVPAAVIALLAVLATGALAAWSHTGIDLTADALNTPAERVVAQLERLSHELVVEFIQSPSSELPSKLKSVAARVHAPFAKAGIEVVSRRADALPPELSAALACDGVGPFEIERVQQDTVVSQRVWSALRLTRGSRSTAIPRLDEHTSVHLDFLIDAALRRLDAGRAPLLSVVSDLPRLSPAEALEDYQKKGLSAPGGTDVYSRLKQLLGDYGYRLHHVNRRYPQLADASDAVLWMQPRRDSGEIILQLSHYLAAGGTAIVAMQHFNVQQRQYRGTGFETVYWPQPQFQDFDRYLRLAGVEQVRQVLMDRTRHHLELDTQVNRTAVREYDAQQVALPFLIRTVSDRYNPDAATTRDLGDLLFVWGNSFDLSGIAADPAFEHQVLINTSARAWSFPWKGGWLPPPSLVPPQSLDQLLGPQPLAVDLRGPFPEAHFVEDEEGRSRLEPVPDRNPERGRLLLIGSSEMFKNEHLNRSGFQHEQLLLNLVADAVYGPEMARLQGRHRRPRGFAYHDSVGRGLWRLAVIGSGPAVLALLAAYRYRRRRRDAPVAVNSGGGTQPS